MIAASSLPIAKVTAAVRLADAFVAVTNNLMGTGPIGADHDASSAELQAATADYLAERG